MEREKALEILKPTIKIYKAMAKDSAGNLYVEAFDMAIKALEQEPILDKIKTEITAISISGQVDEHTMFVRTGEQVKQMALDVIDKYKTESEDKE